MWGLGFELAFLLVRTLARDRDSIAAFLVTEKSPRAHRRATFGSLIQTRLQSDATTDMLLAFSPRGSCWPSRVLTRNTAAFHARGVTSAWFSLAARRNHSLARARRNPRCHRETFSTSESAMVGFADFLVPDRLGFFGRLLLEGFARFIHNDWLTHRFCNDLQQPHRSF